MSGLILVLFFGLLVAGGGILLFLAPGSDDRSASRSTTPSPEDLSDPNELIDLAEQHESRQNWTKAKQTWSHLIKTDPDREDAIFRRGICFYRTGDYDLAIKDFESVLEQTDEEPPAALYLYMARAYQQLDQLAQAYRHYETYVERGDPEPSVLKTVADLARHLEKWSQANTYYETLREEGDDEVAIDASLALADMAFQRKMSERAEPYLEELAEFEENGAFSDDQQLTYNYLLAQSLESEDKHEQADRIIRTIYQEQPDFRDVKSRVEEQIARLEPEKLPKKFQRMQKNSFREFCQRIVGGLDYEVVESEFQNPEELDIIARERSMGLQVTRVLFVFKKWNETVGEIPIKEFEFKIVENRHDMGYFVSPAGYKPAAEHYAEGNESLNLLGPQQILSHFKDWYLSDIHGPD